jgi:hypothetical protein
LDEKFKTSQKGRISALKIKLAKFLIEFAPRSSKILLKIVFDDPFKSYFFLLFWPISPEKPLIADFNLVKLQKLSEEISF